MWCRRLVFAEALLACGLWTAAQADVTVTALANSGVLLEGGEARVMIDGLVVEPYAVYGGLPAEVAPRLLSARGEFAGVDLVLVSHRHHEHNQPEYACRFMQAASSAELYSSEQVIGLMREFCRPFVTTSARVHTIEPTYESPVTIEGGGAKVTVFPISHGSHKFARIRHFGHRVEINGRSVLHVGDAVMDPAEFERAGLAGGRVDVALIPVRYFQPGPGHELIRRYLDAPMKIATHIPPGEMDEIRPYLEAEFPQVLVLEPMQKARFSGAAPANR